MKRDFGLITRLLLLLLAALIGVLSIAVHDYLKRFDLKVLAHEIKLPLPPSESLRILALGDMAESEINLQRMAQWLETVCQKMQPTLVALTGDNFKPHGVYGIDDTKWKRSFENLYAGPCLSRTKFFAVLGNHDYEGDASAQIEYTGSGTGRWNMPARNYIIQAGKLADLIFIDSNLPSFCRIADCELDTLLAKTQESEAAWRLIFAHHPLNSTGTHRSAPPLASLLLPVILCRGKIDAMVAGHDHNLQHQILTTEAFGCPMHEFVSGGGGSDLYPVETKFPQTAFAKSSYGALFIDINSSRIHFEFLSPTDNKPLYQYQLLRKGSQ